MKYRSVSRFWPALAVLSAVGASVASEPPIDPQKAAAIADLVKIVAGSGVTAGAGDAGKLPAFEEVTKGMQPTKGLFTLWSYPADAKDQDPEKLLCQIPAGLLGEQIMLSTSVSGGGFFTGFPLDERVVKWELLGNQLLLVEPDTRYVVNRTKEVSDVVQRTYPERIRVAIPLVTKSPSGDPVIDFGALLKSEFADIGWMTGSPFSPMGFDRGRINPALSKWTKKKSFELNVELGVALAVSQPQPPGSYEQKLVHYSFWKLPASDYQPRVADERVGYFITVNQDWAKPTDSRDLFNRYIDRWHLEKRDPSLAMCEPKQPIIFYIEKTVPVRFRRAVRDGILEWNRAFEKIGFVNAVEVRQQTDDNEWKDLDPEDMRYSFFRWIVTGAGFAMGPHRANPFTGQIYDADIIFDDSMVRYFEQEARTWLPSGLVRAKFADPTRQAFLERFPEFARPTRDWEQFNFNADEDIHFRQVALRRYHGMGRHACDYAEGMKHQIAFGRTALAGQPPEVIERFLYDVVKEVVMHEVGHTLGLRHNFKASSVYTLEQIELRRKTGEPTTGSVMDYNPVLVFGKSPSDGFFLTPTLGPYDHWAIEYGYRSTGDAPAAAPKAEPDTKFDPTRPQAPQAAQSHQVETAGTNGAEPLRQIPPELLAQMPPEIREAIKSGDGVKMMAMAADTGGSGALPMPGKPATTPSFPAAPAGEREMLAKIAARANEPELAYATDEDTTFLSPDPRTNRFDCSADPIDWANARIALLNERMKNILDWSVKDGESWYHLRAAFSTLMFEKAVVMDYVGRYIGGQYFHRTVRGDKDAPAPFVLVEPELQRRALKFIADNMFSDTYFQASPTVLNHIAPSRWWHEGTTISFSMDFPIHSLIATLQWWNLVDRLDPNTLRRIHDAEMKTTADDRFTVAEYLQRISTACWEPTNAKRLAAGQWTDTKPFIDDLRRSLQREYLGIVEPLVRQRPGVVLSPDLHAMVRHSLQELLGQLRSCTAEAAKKSDFASRAHLDACVTRIERMLAPELREFEPRVNPGIMMMGHPANERN